MQMEDINIIDIKVDDEALNIGDIKADVEQIYPDLEDLEITPTEQEQNFKSKKYGYNNVKVKAVEGEELNIIPSMENQQYKGLYSDVNVNAIESEEITITPTIQSQEYKGLYNKVSVSAVEGDELYITPSPMEQVKEGLYEKVTVAGDNNLVADNIKQGISIFGVEGNAKTTNLKITDARYLFYVGTRLDILNELLALCENIESTSNMFYNCNLMKSIDLTILNTSRVKDMSYMFYYNGYLKDVNLSNCDFGKVETLVYMFRNCTALENLLFGKNLGKGYTIKQNNYSSQKLDLSTCTKLTHESLMNVINNLYDLNLTYNVANGGTLYTQQLVLGSTNINKLSSEELNIVTNKGWVVS